MTDALLDLLRQALRTEIDAALDARLAPLEQAVRAATPARLLTVAQLTAEGYGSDSTIRRRIKDGTLPVIRVGRSIRVNVSGLRPITHEAVSAAAREARR
ncbi:MAG: hypothetical protein ABSB49_09840 [Polyangia bacterium]|jgi:hypothetical protein